VKYITKEVHVMLVLQIKVEMLLLQIAHDQWFVSKQLTTFSSSLCFDIFLLILWFYFIACFNF